MRRLSADYYLNPDVEFIARDLLGKVLMTSLNGGEITGGIITETEAYKGETDRASHAYGGRRTARTATMYMKGGVAYVYLCYGMHHLFNVVTNEADIPHAVLIRAIKPICGGDIMARRIRPENPILPALNGPGKLTKAMGIDKNLDKTSLTGNLIWIEESLLPVNFNDIVSGPRIGIAYAGEHANLHMRFWLKEKPADEKKI